MLNSNKQEVGLQIERKLNGWSTSRGLYRRLSTLYKQ